MPRVVYGKLEKAQRWRMAASFGIAHNPLENNAVPARLLHLMSVGRVRGRFQDGARNAGKEGGSS